MHARKVPVTSKCHRVSKVGPFAIMEPLASTDVCLLLLVATTFCPKSHLHGNQPIPHTALPMTWVLDSHWHGYLAQNAVHGVNFPLKMQRL